MRNVNHLLTVLLALTAVLFFCSCNLPANKNVGGATVDTPIFSAKLLTVNDQAIATFRFKKPLLAPLNDIVADVNGRVIKKSLIEGYPQAGQSDLILLLTDISGLGRAGQITIAKRNMLLVAAAAKPHNKVIMGVYGQEPAIIAPKTNDPKEFAKLLAVLGPVDEPANPLGAVVRSIRTLDASHADRKAIFLFTDGSVLSGGVTREDATRLAREKHVLINIVYTPSDRRSNSDELRQLADATGGVFVEPAQTSAFLHEPFALLDSGGNVKFFLADERRLYWENDAKLTVTFAIRSNRITISRSIGVPLASLSEHLARAPIIAGSLIALGLTVPLCVLGWLLNRRCYRVFAQNECIFFGILKDMKSGQIYSIQKSVVQIGRSRDNDVVISDLTVSRHQAILEQADSGEANIKNLTPDNSFKVNGVAIDKKNLADGDVIEIGSARLLYSSISRGNTNVN